MERYTASLWLEREDKPHMSQSSQEIEKAKSELAQINAIYKAQDQAKLAKVRAELAALT